MAQEINATIRGKQSNVPYEKKTVVLGGNMVGERNILTQDMLLSEDTKYIIRWAFDLDAKTVIMPAGSSLEFNGGSINNGTIVLNDTPVYPSYNMLTSGSHLTVEDNPSVGTYNYTDGMPAWWNGSEWKRSIDTDEFEQMQEDIDALQHSLGTVSESVVTEKERAEGVEDDHNIRITALEEKTDEIDEDLESKQEQLDNKYNKSEVYSKSETYNKDELNSMITTPNQEYVSVGATSQTTAVTDVLPATGEADTIYRVGNWNGIQYDTSAYSEYSWNGSSYIHISTKTQIGEVYDISSANATGGELAKYANLTAALDGGNNVPQSVRKGGMSIKFVLNSDNKYVQYMLLSQEFTTDTNLWAVVLRTTEVDNPEFVCVFLSGNNRILFGARVDGDFYFGGGVPSQIKNYVLDHKEEIIAYVDATKVEKEEGKSLIQDKVAESVEYVDNNEFVSVELDANKRILGGRKVNGNKFENMPVENTAAIKGSIEDPEERLKIELDRKRRIISYRDKNGVLHENAGIETPIANVKTFNAEEINLSNEGKERLLKERVYIYNQSAMIASGEYRNITSFKTAPPLEYPVYGKVLVKGIDAFVSFRQDGNWKTLYEIPLVENGVETEILIPAGVKYIIVGTASKEPVAQDTYFDFILYYYADDYEKTKDIIDLRRRNKYVPVLENLNLTKIGAGNLPSVLYKPLVLLSLTDIHNDDQGARCFFNFYNQYKQYLDDVIGLGDYQDGGLEEPLNINQYNGWHEMLKTIGNHDAYLDWEHQGASSVATEQVCYETFMADDIANWGVVYQENKTYFYKDYDDAKIRVVFLDYMHWDEQNDADGQKAWLQNILYGQNNEDSAATKGYQVVVCVHTVPRSSLSGGIIPFENCTFEYFDADLNTKGYFESSVTEIINEFQTNHNGIFICYLLGHRHVDFTGTFENYPNQIVIMQACTADFKYARDSAYTCDTDYSNQFNIYSFDSETKYIRVYRVGAEYNRNMQHKESMLIQYGDTVRLLSCF